MLDLLCVDINLMSSINLEVTNKGFLRGEEMGFSLERFRCAEKSNVLADLAGSDNSDEEISFHFQPN